MRGFSVSSQPEVLGRIHPSFCPSEPTLTSDSNPLPISFKGDWSRLEDSVLGKEDHRSKNHVEGLDYQKREG